MSVRRAGSSVRRGAALAVTLLASSAAFAHGEPVPGSLRQMDVAADGRSGVRGIGGASGIAVSPDSRHVYVTGIEDDAVAVFVRDRKGLAFVESDEDGEVEGGITLDGLDGAADVAVSPDGKNVYLAASKDDAVVTFARNIRTGRLRFLDLDRDDVDAVDGVAGASGVAVTPDGAGVYVAGFEDGAVASFSRESGSGKLHFLEMDQPPDLAGAFALAVAPDSGGVYSAWMLADRVVAFRRDRESGALEFASSSFGMPWYSGPVSIAVSPYGRDVYATMLRNSAVNRFRRSTPDQALTFTGFVRDGVAGTNGIGLASGVAISPDATSAYVTGAGDDALAFFSIRDTTGALHYRARYRQGRRGVDGLDGAAGVAIAPNGRRVYAIANGEAGDTVASFARRTVPLLDTATARDRQRLRRLEVVVQCSRSCRLNARAHGVAEGIRFASGRFTGKLDDDVSNRIRLRFHRGVRRALRGEHAEVEITLAARDRLGTRVRRKLSVEFVP